jgi:hypothetical protein
MEPRATERDTQDGDGDARMSLATWLRAGRNRRKLSIDDVARITKIQPRILEKLESGQLEGLPAEVFVKGFVRSFAKCVGLDETEALDKYSAAQARAAQPSNTSAKAFVESMARPLDINAVLEARTQGLAQGSVVDGLGASAIIEEPIVPSAVIAAVEAPLVIDSDMAIEIETPVIAAAVGTPSPSKRKRGRGKQRNRKRKQAQEQKAAAQDAVETAVFEKGEKVDIDTSPIGLSSRVDGESLEATSIEAKTSEPVIETPALVEDGAVTTEALAEGSDRMAAPAREPSIVEELSEIVAEAVDQLEVPVEQVDKEQDEFIDELGTGTWQPTMPPIASVPSLPWRRPNLPATRAAVVPTLLIDDADPDSADREREDRVKEPQRLSFLPPILMDREDRSTRQGGLTLAVIILLIAATLTLSYLMRRPSPSGDGVTMIETHTTFVA